MLKIHAFPPSPRAFKALAVVHHLNIDYEFQMVDLGKGEQSRPGFVAMNPNKRMPVLEENGFVLWESNAIVQYLATKKPESGLLPLEETARANVTRWQFWESTTFDPPLATLMFERVVKNLFGRGAPDPAEVEKGLKRFHQAATVLEGQLNRSAWVCGKELTVADFAIGSGLIYAAQAQLPLADYPNIQRWYGQLSKLPAWEKTLRMAMPPR